MYLFTHYWQKWLAGVILYCHEVQIRLKLIYLDFIFLLHYGQRITQVCFNVVFMQCLCFWTVNNDLIFAVFFSCVFLQHSQKLSLTALQQPFYFLRFVWGVSAKISDFQKFSSEHVKNLPRCERKLLWTKAFSGRGFKSHSGQLSIASSKIQWWIPHVWIIPLLTWLPVRDFA